MRCGDCKFFTPDVPERVHNGRKLGRCNIVLPVPMRPATGNRDTSDASGCDLGVQREERA